MQTRVLFPTSRHSLTMAVGRRALGLMRWRPLDDRATDEPCYLSVEMAMTTAIDNKALVLDLVEWVAVKPRPYTDVMDAWRTSCPRLPIWEDALDLGLVVCEGRAGEQTMVTATRAGREFVVAERG